MWFPNIVSAKINDLEIKIDDSIVGLFIKNELYMSYDTRYTHAKNDIVSHNYLARGHVIATGMGFLIREKILLDNPRVNKLTVLELNSDLIEYHRRYNKEIIDRIEVINCDANEYKGSCDVLLIDHHNLPEKGDYWINFDKCTKNIQHEVAWFWPIEAMVNDYNHYKNLLQWWPTLPNLSEEKFNEFKEMSNIWWNS